MKPSEIASTPASCPRVLRLETLSPIARHHPLIELKRPFNLILIAAILLAGAVSKWGMLSR